MCPLPRPLSVPIVSLLLLTESMLRFVVLALISVLTSGLAATVKPAFARLSNSGASSLVSPDVSDILEEACLDAASRMERVPVPVSTDVHPDGQVGISYVHWEPTNSMSRSFPIFLVHGFDSSCLEYRRLGPELAAQGIDTYAVDILGWGFTDLKGT